MKFTILTSTVFAMLIGGVIAQSGEIDGTTTTRTPTATHPLSAAGTSSSTGMGSGALPTGVVGIQQVAIGVVAGMVGAAAVL